MRNSDIALKLISILFVALTLSSQAHAVIIDFAGGTATFSDGTTQITNDTDAYLQNVDFYEELGFKVDFLSATGSNGLGIIGNYYGGRTSSEDNSVMHAHWGPVRSIVFSKLDGTSFDLNYMDLTSNTKTGGLAASGDEQTFVTASNGYSMLLPSSDWGVEYLHNGTAGDGIKKLYLDSNFDSITSFSISTENAYCFGLDNFYIDQPAPPAVPEPTTMILFGLSLVGFFKFKRN